MTRNKSSFLQMKQKFGLSKASIDKYKNFLIANKLIAPGNSEEISYLFKNPFGIWSLRMEKGPIITQTRANGLKKLSLKVEQANNNIDGDRPTYSMNTFRLTPQQFVEYKNDMATVLGKYFDLPTVNLEKKIKHQQVWSVWMSDILSLKASENDNIYFGKVKEF